MQPCGMLSPDFTSAKETNMQIEKCLIAVGSALLGLNPKYERIKAEVAL